MTSLDDTSLPAAIGQDQHDQINGLHDALLVTRRDDLFADDELCMVRHRRPAIVEDTKAVFIIPVVNDVLHEIGVGPGRN